MELTLFPGAKGKNVLTAGIQRRSMSRIGTIIDGFLGESRETRIFWRNMREPSSIQLPKDMRDGILSLSEIFQFLDYWINSYFPPCFQ
jgi:hypothetical protein